MKSSIIAMSVAALLAFGAATAAAPAAKPAGATPSAAPAKTLTPQQQKMSDCSKANKGKKGADFKASQKACLSGKPAPAAAAAPATAAAPAAAAPMTPQERMKSCNADAAKQTLKGDARKTFMNGCLKKK